MVAGSTFTDRDKDCVLANRPSTSHGESAFALSEFGTRRANIMFRDITITWDASGESITFQTDGNLGFTAQAQTDTTCHILVVAPGGTPSTTMDPFMRRLASGRQLLVTSRVGSSRTFALDGAQAARDAFGRCIAAIPFDGDRRP